MASLLVFVCATLTFAALVAVVEGVCTVADCEGPARESVLLQRFSAVMHANDLAQNVMDRPITCDESLWPDKDNGLVCGECKVLVNRFNSFYKTCRGYCNRLGRQCVGAWEESSDTCHVSYEMTCDQSIDSSDAICECGPEVSEPEALCVGSNCRTISVMSYNTEYKNYNARMGGYAAKIKEIAPAIVGLQECQNRDGLAQLSGYMANRDTDINQNYMLFDPSKVFLLSGGHMRIPRDNYAERFITWGQFKLGDVTFWFFNTHLPHNHNQALSKKTHAKIAGMFLQKRRELGADNSPTIVVGDMNSHASNFNRVEGGGFESNLVANGFTLAYTAKGNPGHGGIDHILYSTSHWQHSGCRDTGTGGSDHPSITCDLELI